MSHLIAFQDYLFEQDKSQRTIEAYYLDVQMFLRWYNPLALMYPDDYIEFGVTSLDIKDFRQYMIDKGLSPYTINRRLVGLRVFFDFLVKRKVIVDNPTLRVRRVQLPNNSPKYLSRNELNRLFRAIEHNIVIAKNRGNEKSRRMWLKYRAIVHLMAGAGLRASEVTSLRRRDIDFTPGHSVVRVLGKGRKYRRVPLNSDVRLALLSYFDLFSFTIDAYPFGTNRKTYNPIFTKLAKQANITKLTPHMLRHTFGKNLVASTGIEQVAQLMGHSTVDTTRVYTVPTDVELQQAVEKISFDYVS